MEKSFAKRDRTPLPDDAWIKFQSIRLGPGISSNYRFLIMQDGRLFYSANRRDEPEDRTIIYNTPMPELPTRTLSPETMDEIRDRLEETDFFSQAVFQRNLVRDGGLRIVSIRKLDIVHEVWYVNVHNALTDYLRTIGPDAPIEKSEEEKLADLQKLLEQQKNLLNRLKGKSKNNSES